MPCKDDTRDPTPRPVIPRTGVPRWRVTADSPLMLVRSFVADGTTRSKLSQLDGKLKKLERRMEFVEATLQSAE